MKLTPQAAAGTVRDFPDGRSCPCVPRDPASGASRGRSGFVLLAVLVFVLLLSMVVASLLFQSAADESAANASAGSEQAWAAALSGVAELIRAAPQAGGPEIEWQDNPRRFKHQLVFDDGADRWYFTAFVPAPPDSLAEIRYGLVDNASRLNLRHANVDQIAKLPRMTTEIARTVRDAFGATVFLASPSGSTLTNGLPPLDPPDPFPASDVDPLLAGAAPASDMEPTATLPGTRTFLGEDLNRNGHLDPGEDLNGDGALDRGLAEYVTLDSSDPDLTSDRRERTSLNDPSSPLPDVPLPPAFTNYLGAVRSSKVRIEHPADTLEATVQAKSPQGADLTVPSGIGPDELPLVLEHFTSHSGDPRQGLVNLNTASAQVLATIPGIDETLAESIVSTRTAVAPERRRTTAWLLQEGLLTAAQFKAVAPHLTARSYQFHCRVAGYGIPSGRYRVLQVGIDTSTGQPSITELIDVTRLGFPLSLDESGEPGEPGAGTGI